MMGMRLVSSRKSHHDDDELLLSSSMVRLQLLAGIQCCRRQCFHAFIGKILMTFEIMHWLHEILKTALKRARWGCDNFEMALPASFDTNSHIGLRGGDTDLKRRGVNRPCSISFPASPGAQRTLRTTNHQFSQK